MNDAHEQIIEQLSDYIDDELSSSARAELERHIAGCAECRTILTGLRAVKEHAASLPNMPPREDLWEGVAARLSTAGTARVTPLRARSRRKFAFTMPQLAAAGIALMVLSGGVVWLAERGDSRADFPAVAASSSEQPVNTAAAQYGARGECCAQGGSLRGRCRRPGAHTGTGPRPAGPRDDSSARTESRKHRQGDRPVPPRA